MPLPKNVGSFLFPLPTICDAAPATIPSANHDSGDACRLHEDDWRQIEFIPVTALAQVDREMAEIEVFKRANWTGAGFKSVYIRKERPDGLFPNRLPYDLIDSIPHDPMQSLMIGTTGTPQREAVVKGGFACRLDPSVFIYGRQSGGIIIDLGLSTVPDKKESAAWRNLLVLCTKFNLCIADWCPGRVIARPAGRSL